jgi:hypothetical protein
MINCSRMSLLVTLAVMHGLNFATATAGAGAHGNTHLAPDVARHIIGAKAARVILALRDRKLNELGTYVHPTKALRLSPFRTVDAKTDRVLRAPQIAGALSDTRAAVWGYDDGSGEPIRLTFAQYYAKFLYDRDFAAATDIRFNAPDKGTRAAWEYYPNAIVVGYHLSETEQFPAETLRLVFESYQSVWYLVAIIHDGWTI